MNRLALAFLLLLASLSSACAGTQTSRLETAKGPVYVGMSGEELTRVLGAPHSVTRGQYPPHAGAFFGLQPGVGTIEWAWTNRDPTIVAYLDFGSVSFL